jgi:protein TonB
MVMNINTVMLPLLLTLGSFSQAQQTDSYYIFDGNWNPIKNINRAKFLMHTAKVNDTCWQWDYYNFKGPLIKIESYRDADGKVPNGFFAYYNNAGYLDSCGYVVNQRKDRLWTYFQGDSGKVYFTQTFEYGKLVKSEDYRIKRGPKEEIVDKTLSKVEVESEFPGGAKAWQTYLTKNLNYPQRAVDLKIDGTVWILFIVDTEGKITEPVVAKSAEFSMDQESLRMIRNSPLWTPAFQNGRKVKSYKKQPLVFRFQ